MAKKGKGGKGGKKGKGGKGKKAKGPALKPGERNPCEPLVIGARLLLKYSGPGDDQRLARDLLAPLLPKDPDEAASGERLPPQGVDAVDEEYGWSMLMWAARAGYRKHVEALLAAGSKASLESTKEYWLNGRVFPAGSNALDIARTAGRQAVPVAQMLEAELTDPLGDDDDPMEWVMRPMTPSISSRGPEMFMGAPSVRTPYDLVRAV